MPVFAGALLGAAHRPPAGELLLDAHDPVIAITLDGIPMRLRVGLEWEDTIELNPAAAARLAVAWQDDAAIQVGRVRVAGHIGTVSLRVAGKDMPTPVTEHGRDCCADVDGGISPSLLPYRSVRWHRADAPAATASLTLPLASSPATGLTVPADHSGGDVNLRFSAALDASVTTAAAAAELARRWGGRWDGPVTRSMALFGIERPARVMAFANPGLLAGFRFDRLEVRISDFGGREKLPADPIHADEVVVARQLDYQAPWSSVTIGADRLDRCADIVYTAIPRRITLSCAFDPAR